MRANYLIVVAAALIAHCAVAYAGKGGGPSSSGGSRTSTATSRSTTAAPSSRSPSGRISGFAARPAGRTASGASTGVGRRSLLGTGSQPSPRVTEIIRERESSGPGWLGTVFLISLLSQHDLSASDRSWVQEKLAELRTDAEDEEPLIPAAKPKVVMTIKGVADPLHIGVPATFSVAAATSGKPLANIACTIDGSNAQPTTTHQTSPATVTWVPEREGAYILNCKAGGRNERRVLRVAVIQEQH